MDLTTIAKQVKKGTYGGEWQLLVADVKLVRDNACAFNRPGDAVFRFANELWDGAHPTLRMLLLPPVSPVFSFPRADS